MGSSLLRGEHFLSRPASAFRIRLKLPAPVFPLSMGLFFEAVVHLPGETPAAGIDSKPLRNKKGHAGRFPK